LLEGSKKQKHGGEGLELGIGFLSMGSDSAS